MSKDNVQIVDYALKYAKKYGWAVFPVSRKTKKPLTPHGCKDAKKEAGPIKAWWKKWPDANIGIATGAISELVVVDLDLDEEKGKDGIHQLILWERENGELPGTAKVLTGRGGNHLYYHHADPGIKNQVDIIEGIDVRGDGGYVIAPPSVHQNGTVYEWEEPPTETPIAELDEVVMKLLAVGEKKQEPHQQFQLPDKIGSGSRNTTLHKLACSMQAQGMSDDAIMAAVAAENAERCEPPLEDEEIERIVQSALQYRKGELKVMKISDDDNRPPKFTYKIDKNGELTDQIAQTVKNCEEAIGYDTNLRGRIQFNELTGMVSVYGSVPWEEHKGWRDWKNSDDSALWSYVESKYGLSNKDKIFNALENVAHRRHCNTVKDMLEQAAADWDGNHHIETLLPQFVGADLTEYNTEVMKLFMLGAIKRIYQPGCKFDYMLILVGPQGAYKSSFLRFLAADDNVFSDNFNSIDGDRAFEKLRGMWIVEMSELQATKRAKDVEAIKAFITSRKDTYRAAYARRTEQHPRQCVLAGTSNPVDFLTDQTGNRRFLPVTCAKHEIPNPFDNEIETKWSFHQAWGEAMDIYARANGKVRLVLPDYLAKQALDAQTAYMEEDPDVGIIQEWLDNECKLDRVCVKMIWDVALKMNFNQMSRMETNRLHNIMKNQISGWKYVGMQKCGPYGTQRSYDRDRKMVINDEELPWMSLGG